MRIADDKMMHFTVWSVSTLIFNFILYFCFNLWNNIAMIFMISNPIELMGGVLKEVYDCHKLKTTGIPWLDKILRPLGLIGKSTGFSVGDLCADTIGIIVGDVVFIIGIIIILEFA